MDDKCLKIIKGTEKILYWRSRGHKGECDRNG